MWCIEFGSEAVTERPERTAQGYRRFRCRQLAAAAGQRDKAFMRDNWLSNRVFANEDDLVDHCCHAWNKLEAQPWRIMSLGLRDWAHRF